MGDTVKMHCRFSNNLPIVTFNHHPDTIASAVYSDNQQNSAGWGKLTIKTNEGFPEVQQATCAGALEGRLTATEIANIYYNFYTEVFGGLSPPGIPEGVISYFKTQIKFAKDIASSDPTIQRLLAQVENIQRFAQQQDKDVPDFLHFYIFLSAGDLYEIMPAFSEHRMQFSPAELPGVFHECSSIIKVLENDIYFGQNTWRSYSLMAPRVYKFYDFAYNRQYPGGPQQFSSTPGYPFSKDDFYVLGSGLVVMETTNGVYNETILKNISPESLLFWQRVVKANTEARYPEDWVKLFVENNSGTYNNQWMVFDVRGSAFQVHNNMPIPPGSFWIVEQAADKTLAQDMTNVLNSKTYWASYNIPFSPEIYKYMGYEEKAKKDPEGFSYTDCPRAKIFRRDHHTIKSMEDMKRIMRYNEFQTDPLSKNSSYNAIASRGDLSTEKKRGFGAIDAKFTNSYMAEDMMSWAAMGPTWDDQEPFSWSQDADIAKQPHHGHPNEFQYEWHRSEDTRLNSSHIPLSRMPSSA
eukprot:TRINITY_DN5198_c0_g1_i1.p1 TRINITY_DN5198_c0_g1~~TRINITY_DN5198_c0_g1_i1.p1  ORF type:complete len:555 (-),score=142.75 TRINITY_DN5198_c0_g1_i1:46-1611(-)